MSETAADIYVFTWYKVYEVNDEHLSWWYIVQSYIIRQLIIRLPFRSMSETAADIYLYIYY